ncbi:tRNA-adenosine deaminase [Rhodospirillum rubrum F11]|uniref:tRNA-specific adenosine deaminase n=3 Tax=Rhodospirillum rubrum TaxID=1085 RepID=Q2RWP1_RHORT|nr:nucleoside deaminase [Rhodospirillum rubrum]ABC21454.1 tRNA-adenosine deaminase [Rhodospirillum rubrum ATCC 11170]AEO47136.1 tRNA-adenosine deaminase [Rhodospirillum rubrum F11]MBK5953048.1 tRNA-specific adenosine deaminase [Rhodospirillum rubrum]QXG81129.1 nucleoside deaminase [Rhodospirillum rubrum]HAQ00405.1 nucleoside deaminase [Rhodospirillum rubrum]
MSATRPPDPALVLADPMGLALDLARAAAATGEVPVGAVITDAGGRPLAACANRTETDHDPTAHAEILAIRAACARRGDARLPDCTLWVTLEPCPMCASAIVHARLARVIFGAYDPKGGAVDHGVRLFAHPGCLHRPEVIGGMAESAAATLLRGFFQALR